MDACRFPRFAAGMTALLAAMAAGFGAAAQTGQTGQTGQTWRAASDDTGALVRAGVFAPEFSLGFACTAPASQGPVPGDGDEDEGRRSVPYGMFVRISGALVDPYAIWSDPAPVLGAVTVFVDDVGYRLPPVGWEEISNDWLVELSMTDPVFAALGAGRDLVLDTGTGAAWRYPTDGLAEGLQSVMAACGAGWAQAGVAAPGAVAAAAPDVPAAAEPEGLLTPEINDFLLDSCEAPYTLQPEAIAAHDLDRDGVADRIVNWSGVTCGSTSPMGPRPFCGAAYCSIEVFLSSRPWAPQSFIGVGYEVTLAANGAAGLRFGGTAGGCARGECDKIFWWDGTQFRE